MIILIIVGMRNTKFIVLKNQEQSPISKKSEKLFRDAQTVILKELKAMEGATS